MAWFWLSFTDGSCPVHQKFAGVVMVEGLDVMDAVHTAVELDLNPISGNLFGNCLFGHLPDGIAPPEEFQRRVLNSDDALRAKAACDAIYASIQSAQGATH
jgi:hypothetical protein